MNKNHIMREAILSFPKQFEFEPHIENEGALSLPDEVILAGMGGSHLAGDILVSQPLSFRVHIHEDYDLPSAVPEEACRESLLVALSYSGNTEETISAFEAGKEKCAARAAIATGGKLLSFAEEEGLPFIKIPNTGIQPRSALGFSLLALAKLLGLSQILKEMKEFGKNFDPISLEDRGRSLAERFRGKVPIIYASQKNYAVAYNWKIKFNETGKIPAFYNLYPELNHNEMTGFDVTGATEDLSKGFSFIFLTDEDDHPQIKKRMKIVERLYTDRGLTVERIPLEGDTFWSKVLSSLTLADWVAYYTAEQYGLEANDVPMVEEFKNLIQ